MYSQQGGRPGTAATAPKMTNRYMKGRLPEGVDFAAYPGRSSTPLPTAESKSAERINQLKIWNEAATNDDKRRLNAAKAKGVTLAGGAPAARRTDSYKEAKDRHSASFHGSPPPADVKLQRGLRSAATTMPSRTDMFADRSDSESDDDLMDAEPAPLHTQPAVSAVADASLQAPVPDASSAQRSVPVNASNPDVAPVAYVPSKPPIADDVPHVQPQVHQPESVPPPQHHQQTSSPPPTPKEAKGCCTIM